MSQQDLLDRLERLENAVEEVAHAVLLIDSGQTLGHSETDLLRELAGGDWAQFAHLVEAQRS